MKIFLDSIGCRLNQSEIEKFAQQFRAAGHTIVGQASDADLVVVNTCAVTSQAASDSRQKIRQAAKAGATEIHVTGCWSTLDPLTASKLPSVRRVIPNLSKDHLVADALGLPQEQYDLEPVARQPLPGLHQRTRAFLKVQDGCDNHCTFCITRVARGAGRSLTVAEVVKDALIAQEGGAQELVLTGVHLGSWGSDLDESLHLFHLVQALLRETDVPRLRLSSLEPWDLDERFFTLWENQRLCRQVHLPLQSGCEATLRRMARKTTPANFARLVELARSSSPDMAITTDVIVGFPGETEKEFSESLAFVQSLELAGGHVFSYSYREGTAAARMPGHLTTVVKKARSGKMRDALAACAHQFASRYVGQTLDVLWESTGGVGPQGWHLHGMTDNALRVRAISPEKLWNRISTVKMNELVEDQLYGSIVG
ncbi:MAG: MiaB/RimO family radical SAM methylthiotransferase [Anaerolineae bacterium]|nr:MiaB/RimO family radical SAM methylthiotransferase [Anaerolineae bacterium]